MLQEGDINITKDAMKPGSVVHACYPSTQEPNQARQSYTVNPHSRNKSAGTAHRHRGKPALSRQTRKDNGGRPEICRWGSWSNVDPVIYR